MRDWGTLLGLRVLVSPLLTARPKIQVRELRLSDGTLITTPDFLARENAWWAERFGYTEHSFMFGNNVVMSPRYAVMLRNAT